MGVCLEALRISEGVMGMGHSEQDWLVKGRRSEKQCGGEQSHVSVEVILKGFQLLFQLR